jgi:hypothetical protein
VLERGIVAVTALISATAFLAVAVLLAVAEIHPYRPRTAAGWLLFLFGTPLVLGALALLSAFVDREPLGRRLAKHLEQTKLAWLATTYLAFRTLLVLGLAGVAVWLVVSHSTAAQSFLLRHFTRNGQ